MTIYQDTLKRKTNVEIRKAFTVVSKDIGEMLKKIPLDNRNARGFLRDIRRKINLRIQEIKDADQK